MSFAFRHHSPLSIIMFDIDHFKKLNDTHGHAAGDQVLRRVGRFLTAQTRTEDIALRYGGEEFVVILPGTDLGGACTMAQRLCTELAEAGEAQGEVRATASFGVTRYRAGESADELLKRADSALYRAKEEGRNRVMSFAE